MADRPSAEAQLISSVINSGTSLVPYRLAPEMFVGFQAEFRWILDYLDSYEQVPTWEALLNHFPSFPRTEASDVGYFADDVRFLASKRALVRTLKDASVLVADGDVNEAVNLVTSYTPLGQVRPIQDSLRTETYLDDYEDEIDTIPVPWKTLSDHTGGMRPGDLWVVGARLGQGKSWTLLNMACTALMAGKSVKLYSLEMPRRQVETRLHAMLGAMLGMEVNHVEMRDRVYDLIAYRKLLDRIKDEVPGQFFIHDSSDGPVKPALIKAHAMDHDLSLVDYVGLMQSDQSQRAAEDWRVAALLSNAMKEIAVASNTRVVMAAQINRDGATAKFPPKMHQLAQSDAIGQDADVALLHTQYSRSCMCYGLEKNRHGGAGYKFFTHFLPNQGRFNEISRERADDYRDEEMD